MNTKKLRTEIHNHRAPRSAPGVFLLTSVLAAMGITTAVGCHFDGSDGADGEQDSFLMPGTQDTGGIQEGSPEALAVLRVANFTSLQVLAAAPPDGVGLSLQVVDNLEAFRLGDDLIPDTDDDGFFDTLAELDAVPFVGPIAFDKLLAFASTQPIPGVVDSQAPVLRGLAIHPQSVDVTSRARTFVVSLELDDDISGVESVYVNMLPSLSGRQQAIRNSSGRYEAEFHMPRFTPPGLYTINAISYRDNALNQGSCRSGQPAGCGEVALTQVRLQVQNTGQVDQRTPRLVDVAFDQASVDVSDGPASVDVALTVSDDLSGVASASIYLSRDGDYAPLHFQAERRSSTEFVATAALPSYLAPGTYYVQQANLKDHSGKVVGTSGGVSSVRTFQIINNNGLFDTEPPTVRSIRLSTASADVSTASVRAQMTIITDDDLTGAERIALEFGARSGKSQYFEVTASADGTTHIDFEVPRYLVPELHKLLWISVTDRAGRSVYSDLGAPTRTGFDIRNVTLDVRNSR